MGIDDLAERLASIEAQIDSLRRQVEGEQGAGAMRGVEQGRIGERVAALEVGVRHLETQVAALTSRATAAAGGSITSVVGIVYLILQAAQTGAVP